MNSELPELSFPQRIHIQEADDSGKSLLINTYTDLSLTQTDSLLKAAIHLTRTGALPGVLKAINVISDRSAKRKYQVKCEIEKLEQGEIQDFMHISGLHSGLSDYELQETLYQELQRMSKIEVYLAKTGFLKRQIAVKLYHTSLSNLNYPIREALLQAKAESLHVCRLLDIALRPGSRDEYEVGLVLEKLQGDLTADIKHRLVPLRHYSESELLQILDNVTDALVFAKLQGIAHLDLKPANIFIDGGSYKLGDFGSACDAAAGEHASGDGTLAYLSPEMRACLLGERSKAELYPSDVFSLGVTMLHLAKLRVPASLSAAWRKQEELESAIDSEMQGLPYSPDFLNLLRSMLNMNPNTRPLIEEVRYFALTHKGTPPDHPGDLHKLLGMIWDKLRQSKFAEMELLLLSLLSTWGLAGLEESHQCMVRIYFAMYYMWFGRHAESRKMLQNVQLEAVDSLESLLLRNLKAIILLRHGYFAEAERVFRATITLLVQNFGEEHSLTLAEYRLLGMACLVDSHFLEKEGLRQRSFQVFYSSNKADSAEFRFFQRYFRSDGGRNRLPEAEIRAHIEALSKEGGDNNTILSVAYFALGESYIKEGKMEEAQAMLQLASSLRYGAEAPCTSGFADLMGRFLTFQGKPLEAQTIHLKGLDAHIREFGQQHPNTSQFYNSLGLSYLSQQQFPDAQAMFIKALEFSDLNGQKAAECYRYLAEVHITQGQSEEAETYLELALDIMTSLPRDLDLKTSELFYTLVDLYRDEGKLQAAEELCLRALALHVEKMGEDCREILTFTYLLAKIYFKQGKFGDYETLMREILNKSKSLFGEDENLATVYLALSSACLMTGKIEEGIALAKKGLVLRRKLLGDEHADTLQAQIHLENMHHLLKLLEG